MPVTVDRIIRSKRRTIALIVESDGAITVRAPLRMSETTIQEFVAGHAHWVEKKQAERRAVVPADGSDGEYAVFKRPNPNALRVKIRLMHLDGLCQTSVELMK